MLGMMTEMFSTVKNPIKDGVEKMGSSANLETYKYYITMEPFAAPMSNSQKSKIAALTVGGIVLGGVAGVGAVLFPPIWAAGGLAAAGGLGGAVTTAGVGSVVGGGAFGGLVGSGGTNLLSALIDTAWSTEY